MSVASGEITREPRTMAAWHLNRCLRFTNGKEIAERLGMSATSLANIKNGQCVDVPFGTTDRLRKLCAKLEAENEDTVDEWDEFMSDPAVKIEVAKLRARNPKVTRIRKELAEKAAGGKKKAGRA